MKAGVVQPMDLPDMVSAAWFLCVRHWEAFLPMALVTFIATMATNVGLLPVVARTQAATTGHETVPPLPLTLTPLLAAGALLLLFNQLAYVRYSLEVSIEGKSTAIRAYAKALRSFLPALGATAITSTVFMIGFVTWVGIPVALYFLVCWFFAVQVCLAEDERNPLRALGRSRSIVRGAWWRTASVLISLTLLALLPSLAAGWLPAGGLVATLILSSLATSLAAPFLAGAQSMLYLDLRMRKHESVSLAPSGPAESL